LYFVQKSIGVNGSKLLNLATFNSVLFDLLCSSIFSSQNLSGTGPNDQLIEYARVADSKIRKAFDNLRILNSNPDASHSNSSPVLKMLAKMYQDTLGLFKEAHDAHDTYERLRDATKDSSSPQAPAVFQKHNVAAFCIATLFSADQGYQDQKLFSHATHTLFSTMAYSPKDPIPVTPDEASKMYERAVTNVHERGKLRNTELEDRDAWVMQQFCVAQESGNLEFASLLSQTLICLCNYLNQRSPEDTSLHPHNEGVPHRHSQVFNRTWCRLAEMRFEEPVLRFSLLQVISSVAGLIFLAILK